MNLRLQVEHPVTEAVTGPRSGDLVIWCNCRLTVATETFKSISEKAIAVRVDDATYTIEASVAWGASEAGRSVAVDGRTLSLPAQLGERQVCAAFEEGELALEIEPLHAGKLGSAAAGQGLVRPPMMGVVIVVDVQAGQAVRTGDRLATMESMKMKMAITAPASGRVAWIGCAPQGKVERHQELFRIEA